MGGGGAPEGVRAMLRRADCFCFDVDSTLIQVEGIDELAGSVKKHEEVSAITKQAMEGHASFFSTLQSRLDIIRPSRQLIEEFSRAPLPLTPGAVQLVATLHARGAQVFLISGGFRQMVEPVATALSVPLDNVYANNLRFEPDGAYKDFDPQSYTACDGGKRLAINHIRSLLATPDAVIVMVGDGATDLDSRDSQDGRGGADLVCGFGGVVVRESVRKGADWFVTDLCQLEEAIRNPN